MAAWDLEEVRRSKVGQHRCLHFKCLSRSARLGLKGCLIHSQVKGSYLLPLGKQE
jgi:hypothetical protein